MKIREVFFNGDEGKLEGRYYQSTNQNAPATLILHPDPSQGGSMNTKVVTNLFRTFANDLDCSVLRFNFRGVGKSEGVFDNGVGELMDAAAALDWLEEENPNASSYWVVGFSFGSWIALHLMMRRPEVRRFIAVAPPVKKYEFNFISPGLFEGMIVSAANDELVKEEDIINLYDKLQRQRGVNVEFCSIKGADHFFDGKLDDLNESVFNYVRNCNSSD